MMKEVKIRIKIETSNSAFNLVEKRLEILRMAWPQELWSRNELTPIGMNDKIIETNDPLVSPDSDFSLTKISSFSFMLFAREMSFLRNEISSNENGRTKFNLNSDTVNTLCDILPWHSNWQLWRCLRVYIHDSNINKLPSSIYPFNQSVRCKFKISTTV